MPHLPRLPYDAIAPHMPATSAARRLGTNSVTLRRAREQGLTIPQAKRWAAKLGLDPVALWPSLVDAEAARFWMQVERGPAAKCWTWKGYVEKGYGRVHWQGRMVGAHEVALTLATGQARKPEQDTCHSCDNPTCVNPAHLRFDTRQSNVDDCTRRNRQAAGERSGRRLLTEEQVVATRHAYAAGSTAGELALGLGVSVAAVQAIVTGRNWKMAPGPITRKTPGKKVLK